MSDLELIGRAGLLEAVLEQAAPQGSLVTLRGPGGVGKTSVARALVGMTRAVFVELDVCSTVDDIVAAIGEAIPLPLASRNITGICATLAAEGFPLLVLDNAEHVIDATARVVGSLRSESEELRIITTSRERLALRGESVVDVTPLEEPDAIELFEVRAREVVHQFRVDDRNREDVKKLIALVDGLPLAIELAASRVRILEPAAIVERLDTQLALLRARSPTVDRHATLEACVSWSFDLLDDEERSVLDQLSIFRGRFGMADAEGVIVCEGWVGDVIESLIEKSLLRVERIRGIEFVPYEGVRRVVEARTEFSDDLIRRYANYYKARMTQQNVRHGELLNVIHAWELTRDRDFALGVELLVESRNRLIRGGFLPRMYDMIETALTHPGLEPESEAWLQTALASCHYAVMDYDALRAALNRAEELARDRDLPVIQARIHLMRAVRLNETDEPQRAKEEFAGALERIDRLPADLAAHVLGAGGLICTKLRETARALEYFESAVTAAKRTEDGGLVARTLSWSALGYFAAGFRQRGIGQLEQALEYFEETNDPVSLTQAQLTLAWSVADIDPERSLEWARKARVSASQSQLRYQGAQCEALLARLDDSDEAVERLRRTLLVFSAQAVRMDRWSAWLAMSLKLHQRGRRDESLDEMEGLIRAAEAFDHPELNAHLRRYLAVIQALAGAWGSARQTLAADPDFLAFLEGEDDDRDRFDDHYLRLMLDFQPLPYEIWGRREVRARRPTVRVVDGAASVELPDGEAIELETRYVLRRLFAALLERRLAAPGESLTLEDLVEAGWPDESMTYESGIRRVYSAIRNLRKLGLEDVVLTAENGYYLSTELDFETA